MIIRAFPSTVRLRLAILVTVGIALSGCAFSIKSPTPGSAVYSPVQAEITWSSDLKDHTLEITIDENDVTSQFTVDHTARRATASLPLDSGSHTLKAYGMLWYPMYRRYAVTSTSATFLVKTESDGDDGGDGNGGGLELQIEPTTLVAERKESVMIVVTVTREGDFNADVTVETSSLPKGITSNAPFVIPASQTEGSLTFSVDSTAEFQKYDITVTGSGPDNKPQDSQTVTLIVSRATGPFTETSPDFCTEGEKKSPDGRFTVEVATGAPSSPRDFLAFFYETDTGDSLGPPIGFDVEYGLGGAGFCRGSTSGVVLSGYTASNNEYSFFLVNFESPDESVWWDVNRTKADSTHVFQPRVFFSPDCTLALVAGADRFGQSKNLLDVIDLLTGERVGSPVPFDKASFSAKVIILNNEPTVEVETDEGTYHFPIDP